MFRHIAQAGSVGSVALRKANEGVSRKHYYTWLSRLRQSGLVEKRNGRYSLSMFGRMVYDILNSLQHALDYHSKLKVVDALMATGTISAEEKRQLVDALIDDPKIKDALSCQRQCSFACEV